MKKFVKLTLLILILETPARPVYAQQKKEYERFTLDSLLTMDSFLMHAQKPDGKNELIFLDKNTLSGRLLHIPKDGKAQFLYRFDMACYVTGGRGKCKTGTSTFEIKKGSLLYIPANFELSVSGVDSALDIYALQSMGRMGNMGSADTVAHCFTLTGIEEKRSPKENVWNSFIRMNSMIFGLYMLPRPIGGDSALTHKWDEVNLVTGGTGKFQVGADIMDVKPGDIIYVKKGNPHFFHSLQTGLDILIFFEMKSMQDQ